MRLSPVSVISSENDTFTLSGKNATYDIKSNDGEADISVSSFISRGSRSSRSSFFKSSINRFTDRSSNSSVQSRIDELTNGKLNGSYSNGKLLSPNFNAVRPRVMSASIKSTIFPEISNFPNTLISRPMSPPVGTYNVIYMSLDSFNKIEVFNHFYIRSLDSQTYLLLISVKFQALLMNL